MTRISWTRALGLALMAAVIAALGIGAFGSPELVHSIAEGGISCPFRLATGVECPFCGMTHATLSLGGGDIGAALRHHALAPLILAVTFWGGWCLFRDTVPTLRGRPLRLSWVLGATALVWAVKLLS